MDFLYFEDAKEFLEGEGWKKEKYINLSDNAHSGLRYTKRSGERRADLFLFKNDANKYCYARILFYDGDKLIMEQRSLKRKDWEIMEDVKRLCVGVLDNYFDGVYENYRYDNHGIVLNAKQ